MAPEGCACTPAIPSAEPSSRAACSLCARYFGELGGTCHWIQELLPKDTKRCPRAWFCEPGFFTLTISSWPLRAVCSPEEGWGSFPGGAWCCWAPEPAPCPLAVLPAAGSVVGTAAGDPALRVRSALPLRCCKTPGVVVVRTTACGGAVSTGRDARRAKLCWARALPVSFCHQCAQKVLNKTT